ncbi:putative transcription factor B3-Domain family [Helianthus annuus]|nr:putative transcription factor B3-Domain family [Helianthus annuus]KAJ0695380.1 putative transcription factor B3-Domain family [Helianthus annuus]
MNIILYFWYFSLEIPYDFSSLLWGGKVSYDQCIELIDDDLSWVVTLKRNVSGPVLGDGFTKFVKDSGIKKDDFLLVKAIGRSTFYVSLFKSCVFENSFISNVSPDDTSTISHIIWRINSRMILRKVLKVVRQLCMLEIGIGMLRWRDGPTGVPLLMVSLS